MEIKLPRNMGMELVRATEASAMMAGQWIGRGDVQRADQAASQAMVDVFEGIQIDGKIVFDKATSEDEQNLFIGKPIGTGEGPAVDVLADPVDGSTQLARGMPGVIAAAAVTPRGSIWQPPHIAYYMEKIIVDAAVAPYLVEECMDAPPAWTLSLIARAKGVKVRNLSVFVLDRPRHIDLIDEIRATGAHVILRPDGDVVGALMVCLPDKGIDVLMGVGGVQEGLLGACAVKALGGSMLGRLYSRSADENATINDAGYDTKDTFFADDLVKSEQVYFAATGITNGPLGPGIRYRGEKAMTNSLVLRCETRTHRAIQAEHLVERWIEFNA